MEGETKNIRVNIFEPSRDNWSNEEISISVTLKE